MNTQEYKGLLGTQIDQGKHAYIIMQSHQKPLYTNPRDIGMLTQDTNMLTQDISMFTLVFTTGVCLPSFCMSTTDKHVSCLCLSEYLMCRNIEGVYMDLHCNTL